MDVAVISSLKLECLSRKYVTLASLDAVKETSSAETLAQHVPQSSSNDCYVCIYLYVTECSEEALVSASWLLTDSPASTVIRSQ